MQFIAIISILASALSVSAAPSLLSRAPGDMTVAQAQNVCGSDMTLQCCDSADTSSDASDSAGALLSSIVPGLAGGQKGLGLFGNCGKLDIAALAGVGDLLNKNCAQNAACCQNTQQQQASGPYPTPTLLSPSSSPSGSQSECPGRELIRRQRQQQSGPVNIGLPCVALSSLI